MDIPDRTATNAVTNATMHQSSLKKPIKEWHHNIYWNMVARNYHTSFLPITVFNGVFSMGFLCNLNENIGVTIEETKVKLE